MWSWFLAVLLASLGLMLERNVASSFEVLSALTLRSPLSFAVLKYIEENMPRQIYQLYLAAVPVTMLGPYAVLTGVSFGVACCTKTSRVSVIFWCTFFAAFVAEGLMVWQQHTDGILQYYFGLATTIPLHLIGVAIGRSVRVRRRPRFKLLDILTCLTATGLLLASSSDGTFNTPLIALCIASWLAWRLTLSGSIKATNNMMDPSPQSRITSPSSQSLRAGSS